MYISFPEKNELVGNVICIDITITVSSYTVLIGFLKSDTIAHIFFPLSSITGCIFGLELLLLMLITYLSGKRDAGKIYYCVVVGIKTLTFA